MLLKQKLIDYNIAEFGKAMESRPGRKDVLDTILIDIQTDPHLAELHKFFEKLSIEPKLYWSGIRGIVSGITLKMDNTEINDARDGLKHQVKLVLTYLHIKDNIGFIRDSLFNIFPEVFKQPEDIKSPVFLAEPFFELMLLATVLGGKTVIASKNMFESLISNDQNLDPTYTKKVLNDYIHNLIHLRTNKREIKKQLASNKIDPAKAEEQSEIFDLAEFVYKNKLRQDLGQAPLDNPEPDPFKNTRELLRQP